MDTIKPTLQRLIAAVSAAVLLMTAAVFSLSATAAVAEDFENLFDITTSTNVYVNANGTVTNSANFFTSDYIEVTPGATLYLGPCVDSQGYQFAAFDSGKTIVTLVRKASLQTEYTLTGGDVIYSYTVPAEVHYIRMSVAAQYGRAFLITEDQPFDENGLLRYLTVQDGPLTKNWYDRSKGRYGYPNADHSITSSASHYTTEELAVATNDTVFFGPCNTSQSFQLYFYPSSGAAATKVNATNTNLKVLDTFDNGQVIYAYRCPGSGTVAIADPSAYDAFWNVTINEPLTVQRYYNYWASVADANLYNPSLDLAGKYVDGSGQTVSNTAYNATHYIAVTEGETLTFGPASGEEHGFAFDGLYAPVSALSAADLKENGAFPDGRKLYTYTVPAGVSYVRINSAAAVQARFLVLKNQEITVSDYNQRYDLDDSTVLYNKSALFVGDSISYGAQDTVANGVRRAWAGRIAEKYGMSYVNNSVSGASLSTARESRQGRIVSQLQKAAGQQFDYVILHGGVNDAWDSYPVGVMSDSFDPADFNTATYAGGLEETIYTAIQLYGETASIGYLINFYAPSCTKGTVSDMSAYFEVGKQICDKWGIAYFDMYNNEEITAALQPTTAQYLPDNIHPNAAGYEILYPYIAEFMMTLQPYDAVWFWEALCEERAQAAEEVSAEYFTPDSFAAFHAAVAAAAEGDARIQYEALKAAGELLVQNDTPIPVSLVEGNAYYQTMKKLGVDTPEEFVALADAVNNGVLAKDVTVYQTADIDLAAYPDTRVGLTGALAFSATYDGQNHTITHATITGSADRTALFPALKGTIRNLVIEEANVTANGWSAILVAHTYGTDSLIENVHIRNSTFCKVGGNNGGGVLTAQPRTDSDDFTLRNCTVSGTELIFASDTGRINIGFLASKTMAARCVIENCYSYNNTLTNTTSYSAEVVGGIIGETLALDMKNSGVYNNQYNGGDFGRQGALIGLAKTDLSVLENCYCDSALTIVGQVNDDMVQYIGCYSQQEGTVTEEELLNGTLAKKLGAGWVQKEIPMVTEGLSPFTVTLKSGAETLATFYTDWEGKLLATAGQIAAHGSIWTVDHVAVDVNTLLQNVFAEDTEVLLDGTLKGDLDHDHALTSADAVILLQYLNGWDVTVTVEEGDLSGDGRISIYDAVCLLQIIAGIK